MNFIPKRLVNEYKEPLVWITGLTIAYFFIEYALNYAIYNQITLTGDYFAARSIEVWGKVIAGIGIALFCSRLLCLYLIQNRYHLKEIPQLKIFFFACCFSIPFSFWLQNKIVFKTVEYASVIERNDAELIMGVRSTITPTYNFRTSSYGMQHAMKDDSDSLFSNLAYLFKSEIKSVNFAYAVHKKNYLKLAKSCGIVSNEKLGTTGLGGTGKLLWTLKSLKEPLTKEKEFFFEGVVRDYYDCIYEDKEYRESHLGVHTNEMRALVEQSADIYTAKSNQYNDAVKRGNGRYLKRANQEWRKGVNEMLNTKISTIPPNLTYGEFLRHPDIKKHFIERMQKLSGDDSLNLYVFDDDYDEQVTAAIQKDVLKFVIPSYISIRDRDAYMKRNNIVLTKSDTDLIHSLERGSVVDYSTFEKITAYNKVYTLKSYNKGDQVQGAYKALVMPLIGLGISAFFLVLNTGLLIISFTPKRYRIISAVVVIYFTFAQPVIALSGDHELADQSYPAKWLYYHESKIDYLHRPVRYVLSSDTVKGLTIRNIKLRIERWQYEYGDDGLSEAVEIINNN